MTNHGVTYDAIYDYVPDGSVNGKLLDEVLCFIKEQTRLSSVAIVSAEEAGNFDGAFLCMSGNKNHWECPNELLDKKVIKATVFNGIQLLWVPGKNGYETFSKRHRGVL